jgi:hypothetical protein
MCCIGVAGAVWLCVQVDASEMTCVPYESAAMRDARAKAEEEKRNKDKVCRL